ncbi:MAG: hypothetical protein WDA22_17585 [Bacteroidota bacterium]
MDNQSQRERMLRSSKLYRLYTTLSVAIATLGVLITLIPVSNYLGIDLGLKRYDELPSVVTRQANEIEGLRVVIDSLQNQLSHLRKQIIDSASKIVSHKKPLSSDEYKLLHKSLVELNSRLSSLEKVILVDPTKAIDMILFQKELQALKATNQTDILLVRQEIDRIYDLNKWLVGLMFTMAIGILSLAIGNIFRPKNTN